MKAGIRHRQRVHTHLENQLNGGEFVCVRERGKCSLGIIRKLEKEKKECVYLSIYLYIFFSFNIETDRENGGERKT